MTFETQKNFLGRTQTIIMAEVQSERWLSWVRLIIASIYGILSLVYLMMGLTKTGAFMIQAIAVLTLISYSSYYLFQPNRYLLRNGLFVFILIFLDITVITMILWSYYVNGSDYKFITSAVYGAYFIAITFTALHHRTSLSLFCGVASVIGYSLLYYLNFKGHTINAELINDYLVRVLLLMAVAGLGGIISRNNSKTIQQVITSEIRYHNLVHRLPEMLFTLDSNAIFLWSNMASHAILGIPAKVLVGRNLRSFLINQDSLKLEKGGVKGTFEIHDFSGNRKFVDCAIQSVDDGSSNAAFEGIMSDVTDRELAISQREEMVNRLFQYQKMESLGTLASGMAHDFNNILQTVNDITTNIIKEYSDPEIRKRMGLISETMADARFLISELFALGRKKPLDYRNVNLNSFFDIIVPQLSNQLGPNYSITLEAPEIPVWVQADPDYLKRVFQNLIGNARDAMPEGGSITVVFNTVCTDDNVGVACIRVCDTGTGIPPELTEKIFDPFFTTKKPGKGTGLGLALVRRIIMLHNGTILVEKTGYEGTTFKIEIPISDATETENDTKILMLNRLHSGILLLDDDPKIREVLKIFLKEFKYPVLEASTSDDAFQKMKANINNCDIVVMDWKLGNENPHTVIKNLRGIKKDLIIIVVSGYPPQHKSIEDMHIQKWFTKPYDKNQLDIEIQKSLHRIQLTRAANYPQSITNTKNYPEKM
jgi:PAS domain S-box-containing protein